MSITLTDEQENLVQAAVKWFQDPDDDSIFEYSSCAGCGKSLVLHCIIERLGLSDVQVAACAYTGASALVMRRNGFRQAKTIHSTIYSYISEYDRKNKKHRGGFQFTGVTDSVKLIAIDEASMVSQELKNDLIKCRKKIIACGDLDQLGPVYGESAFFANPEKVHRLTRIMRQAEGSAIVRIANAVKVGSRIHAGDYGQVLVIHRSELMKHLRDYIRVFGILICGTNRTRDDLNLFIRKRIFGYDGPLPLKGEKMICRKNNWSIEVDGINLVNGLYGEAMSSPSISSFDGASFLLDFKPEFMDEAFKGLEVDYRYFIADHTERQRMKNSPFGLDMEKFEYAYAITTHVSQGSQFNTGIYVQEHFPIHATNLNYTGITRFRERALYVLPDKKKYWPANVKPHGGNFECWLPVPKVLQTTHRRINR